MALTIGQIGEWVVWTTLAVCLYAYVGYPVAVCLVSRLFGRPHRQEAVEPTVSLLIPAHNEATVIREKIVNSLSLDYPSARLQVRVVSDESDDGTDEIVDEYRSEGVELQRVEVRGGKPNAMNAAVPHARGDILVLCDANTMFARDAIRRLVRHFADDRVGAVTGDVRLRSEDIGYGDAEGLFYRLERFTQRCESRLWTVIGVDGGMYAVRRELYVPNRPDTLIDDFVIAMNVARAGRRVVYDPEAVATEDAVEDRAQEFRRRTRTTAGGFQTLFGGRGRPRWNQPGLWWGYLSHKALRWVGPFLLLALLAGNVAAVATGPAGGWRWNLYLGLLLLQALFYALASVGAILDRRRLPRILCVPYYFCLTNAAALAGFFKWLLGLQPVTWTHADRRAATKSPVGGVEKA